MKKPEIIDQLKNSSSIEPLETPRSGHKILITAAIVLAAFVIVGSIFADIHFAPKNETASIESKIQQPASTATVPKIPEVTQEIPKKAAEISLIAVGDISFSRSVERMTKIHGIDYPFSKISDYLRSADIVFGNLETPITAGR